MIEKLVGAESVNVVNEPGGVSLGEVDRIFPELLTIAREAAVELGKGRLCVATIHRAKFRIEVTTPTPISRSDLRKMRTQIETELRQLGLGIPTGSASCRINGNEEEAYAFHSEDAFVSEVVRPISHEGQMMGLLFATSLDPAWDVTRSTLIDHFARHFARTLRHLRYLNSREREKAEQIVSKIFDGIILCDQRGAIQSANAVAKRLLGASPEENWNGQQLSDLAPAFLSEYLAEARAANLDEVNKVTSPPGKKAELLGIHIERLKNLRNAELGWVIIVRDLTKNWQNEQMRSAITIASHEIKTPLNSILGSVDLLLDQDLGDLNEKQAQCLNIAKDDITRLNRLLADILDLTRFDEGVQFLERRKQVALGFLVNKVVKSLEAFANSKNIRIDNKIPRTLPNFKANRDRLQQVLVNLIENAIKYNLPGGSVTVGAELNGNDLRLWVEDTGVGIPADGLAKVFNRFVQLDNYPEEGRQGYGLGLSIAKEIVHSMDGTIEVDSDVGVGSTFSLTLPL